MNETGELPALASKAGRVIQALRSLVSVTGERTVSPHVTTPNCSYVTSHMFGGADVVTSYEIYLT